LPFDQASPELVQQIIDAGTATQPAFSAEISAAATHAFNIRFTAENLPVSPLASSLRIRAGAERCDRLRRLDGAQHGVG
jgi:hypothetical protein